MTNLEGIVLEPRLFDLQRGRLMYNVITAPMIFFFYIISLLIQIMHILSFKKQIVITGKRRFSAPSPHVLTPDYQKHILLLILPIFLYLVIYHVQVWIRNFCLSIFLFTKLVFSTRLQAPEVQRSRGTLSSMVPILQCQVQRRQPLFVASSNLATFPEDPHNSQVAVDINGLPKQCQDWGYLVLEGRMVEWKIQERLGIERRCWFEFCVTLGKSPVAFLNFSSYL